MFGLMVRFTCKDESDAAEFDSLVARTGEQIRANEPGTLIHTVHRGVSQVERGRTSYVASIA